jgi:hypothetical protein
VYDTSGTCCYHYTIGNLSKNEIERRLEYELPDPEVDSIDRELSREHEIVSHHTIHVRHNRFRLRIQRPPTNRSD